MVSDLGGQVIEPSWLGNKIGHRVICKEGHESTPKPNNVLTGQGICRICSGYHPSTAERKFRDRVAELGGQVVEPTWLGTNRRHRVTCAEGHAARPGAGSVIGGRGLCIICAGQDPATAERKFRELVAAQGGAVLEPVWLGRHQPHRIMCAKGHVGSPTPGSVGNGQGICHICAGQDWDVFYVVTNDPLGRVKFGITSNGGRRRFEAHRRNGYRTVVRTMEGLPSAPVLERSVLATLRLAGIPPIQGREYFDVAAIPVILDVADHWIPSPRKPVD